MPPKTGENSRRALLAAAAAATAAFVLFIPALSGGFVNWDDPTYVLENAGIRSLSGAAGTAFTSFYFSNWHPLTLLSYAVDYALWGLEPFGYHLTNNLLHALNTGVAAVLAFKLVSAAGRERGGGRAAPFAAALAAAALFGLHPLRAEPVAWVSGRKDLLCALFFLLAALSHLRYAARPGLSRYLSTLALFALALMSKPMAITLPIVLLILDFYPLGRLKSSLWKALAEKAPFFALSALSAYLTVLAQASGKALMPIDAYPLWIRAAVAVRALGFYLFKTVLPAGLAPFHPLPTKGALLDASFIASAALVCALTIASIALIRRWRPLGAAWLYYLATLVPVIGLVQVGSQEAADRYAYLPLLGPFILAGGLFGALLASFKERRGASLAALLAAVALAAVLSLLTVRQTAVWADSIALWERQISVYPGKASIAYNMRGLAYDEAKRHDEALSDFNASISIAPANAFAYNNRGNALKSLGRYSEAIEDFHRASELDPSLAEPYHNLSVIYSQTGEMELAMEAARRARALGYGR